VPGADTHVLADTGSNPTLPLLTGLGFVAAGIVIVRYGRRPTGVRATRNRRAH
jgi:LPXTG-motif cell wall-anchored protein